MTVAWRRALRATLLGGTILALALFGGTGQPGAPGTGAGEAIVGISAIPYEGPAQMAEEHAFFVALPEETIRASIEEAVVRAFGSEGLRARISPGDRVVVKTNIVEADLREGVVTDPRVCRAVCAMVLEAAGPEGSVTVVDACFGKGLGAYREAGYDEDGDGRLDGLPRVRLVDLDGFGRANSLLVTSLDPQLYWGEIWLPDILRTREQALAGPAARRDVYCDVLISLPNFKNHWDAGMTCALKNRIGCAALAVYGSRSNLHRTPSRRDCLNEAIVDLNRARPNDLAILDGLTGNLHGPNHRSVPAPRRHDYVIHPFFFLASADSVALDAVATHIAGYRVPTITYLAMAEAHGLGTCETARIRVEGVPIDAIRADLERRYAGRGQYPFPDRYGSVNAARRRTDREPPSEAAILEPADGARFPPGPVPVRFRAADAGTGIAKVEIRVDGAWAATVAFDGERTAEGTWTWDASAVAAGPNRIEIIAYDEEFAGRRSEEVTIRIEEPAFVRGEANGDGAIDLADPIFFLAYLFIGGPEPSCLDATDANDDGALDLGDAIAVLQALFAGGPPPADPYPSCGTDPTPDDLGCAEPLCEP